MDRGERKREQKQRRDPHRRQVERTILPELTLQRPVDASEDRDLHFRRDRPLEIGLRGAVGLRVHGAPTTETKRSARLGVRTSPSAASAWGSTPSNNSTVPPRTWRSRIGLSARAAGKSSGRTITSR